MRIVIPGGSGQVGTILARHFYAAGHAVTLLTRAPGVAPWRVAEWDSAAAEVAAAGGCQWGQGCGGRPAWRRSRSRTPCTGASNVNTTAS